MFKTLWFNTHSNFKGTTAKERINKKFRQEVYFNYPMLLESFVQFVINETITAMEQQKCCYTIDEFPQHFYRIKVDDMPFLLTYAKVRMEQLGYFVSISPDGMSYIHIEWEEEC